MEAGLTPRLAIHTPELVTFHLRPAELPTRALAWLLDQLIVLALRIVTLVALAGLGSFGLALWLVTLLLIDFGYFTLMEWKYAGQTVGKRALGLRVATVSGARLEPGDILLRNLLRPVDSLPFTMALGGTIAWLDPHRRRLGDLLAGTVVVREAVADLPEAVFDTGQRVNVFWSDAAVRQRILARVTRDERDLLMDLAQRREELSTLAREAVFADAARHFRARFNLPEAEHLTDEQAVLNVALVVRSP